MSDTSPRQGMSKNSGRSVREERAVRRHEATRTASSLPDTINGTKS